MIRAKHRGIGRYEEGFTLFEVTIVIIIMGIVVTIASSTWLEAVESRRVDSAANHLAADLRSAHSSAANRLEPWRVVLTTGSSSYQIGPSAGASETRNMCGDDGCDARDPRVNIPGGSPATITFNSDGSASVSPSGATTFRVTVDGNPLRDVTLTPATSRVNIV